MKNFFLHMSMLFLVSASSVLIASDQSSTDSEASLLMSDDSCDLYNWYDSGKSNECPTENKLSYRDYRSSPGVINAGYLFKCRDGINNPIKYVDLSDLFEFENLEERLREQFDLDDRDQIIIHDQKGSRINSLEDLRDYLVVKKQFWGRIRPVIVVFTVLSKESEKASSSVTPETPVAQSNVFLNDLSEISVDAVTPRADQWDALSESSCDPVTPRDLLTFFRKLKASEEEIKKGDEIFEEEFDGEEASMDYLPFGRDVVLKVIKKLAQSEDFARNFNRIFKESGILSGLVGDLFRDFPSYFNGSSI